MKSLCRCFVSFCVVLTAITCHASEPVLDGRGIGDLLIGQAPPRFASDRLVSREWQNDETGERYERLKVHFRGIPVEAEVYDGRIWRISVMRRGLRTRAGSQVGDTVKKLIDANPSHRREIGPGPTLVLIPEKFCGISYMSDADLPESIMQDPTRELPAQFSRNARIRWISVTGCKI